MESATLNCAFCNLFGSDNGNGNHFSTMNEAKIHARIHFGQSQMMEDGNTDEGQMFERCFPKSQRKVDRDVAYQGRQSLIHLCHALFGQHPKVSGVACSLCGRHISILRNGKSGKSRRTDPIIDHASIHAGVKIFKCRRCERCFRGRTDMHKHLKHVHGIKPTTGDIEDQSDKFHDEISSSIRRCFTKRKVGALSKDVKENICHDISARSGRMTTASELAVQRQVIFNRTLKESVSSDGNVKCRLCSKKIKAKRSMKYGGHLKASVAILHAQLHLRKPLYRCRVCHEFLNTYHSMTHHLSKKHTLGLEKNNESFEDEYHTDILAVFAQCFEKAEEAD